MPFIGQQPQSGAYSALDSITASATDTYNLTLDGSAYYPQSANQLLVSLNGVLQAPNTSYNVSGSQIIFSSALTASDSIDFITALGNTYDIGTPTDGTVSTAKIATGAVTTAKLDTGAVTSAKLDTNIDIAGTLDVTGALTADSSATIAGNLTIANAGTFRAPTGDYGSIEVDGGGKNGWEGYSIGGRINFMHDNANNWGFWDDVNNQWKMYDAFNGGMWISHAGNFKFKTTSTGVDVSGGITFNGDTAAANHLDDYEEGTWTPDVYNNGKSSSWTTKIGTYQKIGQFVFAEFACDSGASAPSAGGALILSGLPYNIAGMATAARIIGTAYCNATTNSPAPIFFYGGASSTAQIWYAAMNGQDQARLTSGIFGTVMYPAA